MTSVPLSRNPFADPALPTFADLLERLKRDQELPKVKRQNWMWALKTVARAAAKDPAEVLAHPQFVRKLMQRAAPGSIGLTRASWNNARSLLGKVLEWAGLRENASALSGAVRPSLARSDGQASWGKGHAPDPAGSIGPLLLGSRD